MGEWEVPVRSVRRVGPGTVALELETPPGLDAAPGQFVLVRAEVDGESRARHYTMSSPDATGSFELTVGIDPEGDLSGWLAGREPGETLQVEGPFGQNYYEGDGPVWALAGGPGVGAGLGVVERAAAAGHDGALVARIASGGLVHGDRFARLAAAGHPVFVTTTDDGLQEAVTAALADVPDGTAFVFGFRDFVDRAIRALERGGGDPNAARVESYG